ncbi:MAG: DNA polymerase III subunit gamma/tau domain-containing protein [Elusimicrobiales bacterium]
MDSRDGKKKKESIDDILSDLNGLLNKMPSILDGIRMPEPQPEEPRPAPAPRQPVSLPPSSDADKTVVLQAFTGLPEGAPSPAEIAPEAATEPPAEPAPVIELPPAADAGDKTVILEAFNGLPEGAVSPEPAPEVPAEAAPAEDKMVLQSLGDFMFGEGAQDTVSAQSGPADSPEPVQPEPVSILPGSEEPQRPGPEAVFPGLPAEPVEALNLPTLGLPDSQADSTRDFGIPDIDALLQLSEGARPQPGPEPRPATEAAAEAAAEATPEASMEPAAAPGEPLPGEDELAEFEKQLTAAAPQQGEKVENEKPEEEINAVPPQEEPQPAVSPVPEAFIIEPEAPKETGLEAFTIEPSAQEEASPEAQGSVPAADAGETLRLEPSVQLGDETPADQPAVEPVIEAGPGIQFGEPAAQEPPPDQGVQEISLGAPADQSAETLQVQPQAEPVLELGTPPAAAAEEPQLTVGSAGDSTQQFGVQPPQGIELEPVSAAISGGRSDQPPGLTGEETLVVAPPAAASGDEEKTVIFEAGSMPGATSRSQAGDLAGLSERAVPEGIPDERVRGLVFLYAPEDKALCATVLAELDAICLKSQTKPMFVRRSAVKECEADINSNVVLQMVHDSSAIGLVCVGSVPQEKVYELENTFSGGNSFFRHYDSSTFSHSAALDLVADLILR